MGRAFTRRGSGASAGSRLLKNTALRMLCKADSALIDLVQTGQAFYYATIAADSQTAPVPMEESNPRPCSLLRRLAAMTYDGLILIGLWMLVGGVAVVASGAAIETGRIWFQLLLLVTAFVYFGGCWRYGRQTVGMRAWNMLLQSEPSPPDLNRLALRFVVAMASILALGAGFWTALFREDGATWHDRASATQLVVVDQPRRSSQ